MFFVQSAQKRFRNLSKSTQFPKKLGVGQY